MGNMDDAADAAMYTVGRKRLHIYFSLGSPRRLSTSGLVRLLTWWPSAHVAVGYDGVVLDPGIRGNTLWGLSVYESKYPGLVCRFSCQVPADPCFDRFALGERKSWIRTAAHWACRWLRPNDADCVQTVRLAMTNAGVRVPPLCTPRSLYRWLQHRRWPHEIV